MDVITLPAFKGMKINFVEKKRTLRITSQENVLTDVLCWKSSNNTGKGWGLESVSEMTFRMQSAKYWTTKQYFYCDVIYSGPFSVSGYKQQKYCRCLTQYS